MKEFDLIPESYRIYIWKLQIVKISSLIFACILITIVIAYSAIVHAKNGASIQIEKLNAIKEVTSRQQDELNKLLQIKEDLDGKWDLLKSLRSTPPPEDIFYSIDAALRNVEVWFTNLKFERTERVSEQENLVDTGYFIIVNTGNDKSTLSIGTRLLITGGAANHSTLSSFVKNLLIQRSILDAKVLETSTERGQKKSHINYVLEIIVNQNNKAS